MRRSSLGSWFGRKVFLAIAIEVKRGDEARNDVVLTPASEETVIRAMFAALRKGIGQAGHARLFRAFLNFEEAASP